MNSLCVPLCGTCPATAWAPWEAASVRNWTVKFYGRPTCWENLKISQPLRMYDVNRNHMFFGRWQKSIQVSLCQGRPCPLTAQIPRQTPPQFLQWPAPRLDMKWWQMTSISNGFGMVCLIMFEFDGEAQPKCIAGEFCFAFLSMKNICLRNGTVLVWHGPLPTLITTLRKSPQFSLPGGCKAWLASRLAISCNGVLQAT